MAASTPLLTHLHRLLATSDVELGSDVELLQRFGDGRDQAAFATLVERHGPMVLRLCQRVLGDVQAAEDACQATFLVLAGKARHLRHPEALAAWLHGVAYRLALKACAAGVRRRQIEKQSLDRMPASLPADPLDEVNARELLAILDDELQRLPEKFRLPLILCYLEGHSQPEAARLLGLTPGSVKGRLERGRAKLQQRLLRRGLTPPAMLLALESTRNAASARLPALLRAAILRAATTTETVGGISTTVWALAEGSLNGMVSVKWKLVSVLVLMVGVAAGGVGAFAYPRMAARREAEQQTTEATPRAQQSTPSNSSTEKPFSRTDRYGDPLPQGAVARLGTVRFRHPYWVSGLGFTADGKTLASACWDGSVRFWDAATGKETRCFRCPEQTRPGRGPTALLGLALAPDGTPIAVGNHGKAFVWNRETGKELHCLTGRGGGFSLALSPDGKTVAIGDGEGKVQLWDLQTGKPTRQFGPGGHRPIPALAFAPDAKMLAAGDHAAIGAAAPEDGVSIIRLWDATTGRQVRELKGHTGGVTSLTFSRNGRTLVSASHDSTLRFWDPVTGNPCRTISVPDDTLPNAIADQHKGIDCGGILSVAYSPDDGLLASGSFDGTVRIWDGTSGKELNALRGHGREVASVVFSPDGKVLASGSRDHTIRLWEPRSGKQLQPRQGHAGPVTNLTLSPDGRVVAAVSPDHLIRLWNLATQRQEHVLRGHTDFVYSIAFSPDGQMVASGSADRTVRLWDTSTGRELRQLPTHKTAIYSVAFTGVRNMLITGEANGTLHFWEGSTGEELRQLPGIFSGHFLQLSWDGTILASATNNAVHLLDVKTGKELRHFRGAWPRFGLSPNGQTLAMAMQRSWEKIRLWNTATGEELGVLAEEDSSPGYAGVADYVFSPDGRLLARVGKADLEIWEVQTGKLRRRLHGHQAGIRPVAFSPNGKTLLTGCNDTTILIWDVARQQERRPARLSATQLQDLWRDLGADAENADVAIGTLAAAAEQSLPFLKGHLRLARIVEQERLTRPFGLDWRWLW